MHIVLSGNIDYSLRQGNLDPFDKQGELILWKELGYILSDKILRLSLNSVKPHELPVAFYDIAFKAYQFVIEKDPERSYLQKKLGMALARNGRQQEAVELFEKLVSTMSEDIELLLAMAQAYLDLKVRMRADKWATKVIRIDPQNKEAKKILDQCG